MPSSMSRAPAISRVATVAAVATAIVAGGIALTVRTLVGNNTTAFQVHAPDVAGTATGVLKLNITSSGALFASGSIMTRQHLISKALTSCTSLQTTSTGTIQCSSAAAGVSYADAQSYFVDDTGDTMTGSLILNGANVGLTASGQIKSGSDLIASGALIVRNNSSFKGDLTLNSDVGAADVTLTFGSDGTSETLKFLNAADRFEFSDDVAATGDLTASGKIVVQTTSRFKAGANIVGTLSGYYLTPRTMMLVITGALKVGDTAAHFEIPRVMSGYNLKYVSACLQTNGTSGTTDFQIRNVTKARDLLTTKLTIDANEPCSITAATAFAVNGSNDDVSHPDVMAIDVDAVSTSAAVAAVEMEFERP